MSKWNGPKETIPRYTRAAAERYEIDGAWWTLKELSKKTGINKDTLKARIRAGKRTIEELGEAVGSSSHPGFRKPDPDKAAIDAYLARPRMRW